MPAPGGNLAKRVAVAAVGIPLAVALAYLGGLPFALFVGVFAGLAAWELCKMNEGRGVRTYPTRAGLLAAAIPLIALLSVAGQYPVWVTLLIIALGTPVLLATPVEGRPALAASVSVFAALYTGGLLAFAVWLRGLDPRMGWRGAAILFLPIALTWIGDTAAYFVGKGLGRTKLAPTTSPNKTVEGAVGGFVVTVAAAYLYVELTREWTGWTLPLMHVLALGAAISLAGQAGDLVESKFKRDCDVKDSSSLIPGHGGFLDRIDSLLYAFPVTYAYLILLGL